ncbi:hypothetical protein TBLA_0E04810 [Henningerozyma blattae CBS 6284]|uniref:Lunapark zinc ribbon domain-containing protein n=1 Tax=Henningerozyma blattae (strain ATCC 34711 / CBS 6284 / DSM 70876 / NBRC 10599 / NRRL Y-10934 / UCD 77-7) TaxID=1071380 RepID=I2H581_HENB6|nr:hypothetical protein TBLA_0E04810 [Tetrapisispora blattae CBS 6284]CCH61533.1 hypothetical protein TBLA_0E04810 [Tetrapisispora blattae CBS 6284]
MFFRKKKPVLEQYTNDLKTITKTIHKLENKLRRKRYFNDNLNLYILWYGSLVILLCQCLLYFYYHTTSFKINCLSIFISIIILYLLRLLLFKINEWSIKRYSLKLVSLKERHQLKINELKNETNFNMTNIIINRFSSGDSKAEDAIELIDDELKEKKLQLENLEKNLRLLESQKDKLSEDKWFDKVISTLAGGNDINNMFVPEVCKKCGCFNGVFKLANREVHWVCPDCKFENK